eukprot:5252-Heterococcus_DN1.PRE.1
MQQRGVQPNAVCYGAAINACTRNGEYVCALEPYSSLLLEQSASRPLNGRHSDRAAAHCTPTFAVRVLFSGVVNAQRYSTDTVSGTTTVRLRVRAGKWERAILLLAEMRERVITPTVQCYTSAITACGQRFIGVKCATVHAAL